MRRAVGLDALLEGARLLLEQLRHLLALRRGEVEVAEHARAGLALARVLRMRLDGKREGDAGGGEEAGQVAVDVHFVSPDGGWDRCIVTAGRRRGL